MKICFSIRSGARVAAVLLALSFAAVHTTARGEYAIAVIPSDVKPIYSTTLEELSERLSSAFDVHKFSLASWRERGIQSREYAVRIALGSVATEALFAEKSFTPVISVLIPSSTFLGLLEKYPHSRDLLARQQLAAIYMDQPADRQVNLARLINPDLHRLGTLYDQESTDFAMQLQVAARNNGLQFEARMLTADSNPLRELRSLYADIDIYLAVPGKFVFRKSMAKWMLYLSLRNRKPVLGFSREFVEAGALAALFSTPEHIGSQAVELLESWQADGKFNTGPGYPAYFKVQSNRRVVDLLDLELPEDSELTESLQGAERSQ